MKYMEYRWAQMLLGKAVDNNVEQLMSIYMSSYLEGSGRSIHQVDVYGHRDILEIPGNYATLD